MSDQEKLALYEEAMKIFAGYCHMPARKWQAKFGQKAERIAYAAEGSDCAMSDLALEILKEAGVDI